MYYTPICAKTQFIYDILSLLKEYLFTYFPLLLLLLLLLESFEVEYRLDVDDEFEFNDVRDTVDTDFKVCFSFFWFIDAKSDVLVPFDSPIFLNELELATERFEQIEIVSHLQTHSVLSPSLLVLTTLT